MLTYPGRKSLEPESHAALAVSSLPFIISQCAQSCKFMENKLCPTVLSVWGGKKEMTQHERSSTSGEVGVGKSVGEPESSGTRL